MIRRWQRSGARLHVAVLVLYLLLTLCYTYPLVNHLNTRVLGTASDNFEYLWKLWWVPHALTHGVSPFFVPDIYFQSGYFLAYGEITPLHTFLLAPVTLLLGEVLTYNLVVIGSTILTGWLTFLLACRWLARLGDEADSQLIALAAFFAGAAFAFSVYRVGKLQGHLPLFDTQWLALALLAFDLWLERRRRRDALLIGIAVSLAALSTWYFAFMLLLLLPVYFLAYGVNLLQFVKDRQSWQAAGIIALVIGVLVVPFLIPYLQLNGRGETLVPLQDATFWSASPTDYILPNALNPVWGKAILPLAWPFPPPVFSEFILPLGYVVLIFALYGSRLTQGRRWRALKWSVVVAFVLSLGPYLSVSRLPLGIPLPDLLLRQFLPFAASIRTWGRFSMFVMLGCSLLASAGLLLALYRLKSSRHFRLLYVVGLCLLAVMLFEAWSGPVPTVAVEARPVDRWLAQQPDHAPMMEFPLSVALSGPSMYYTRTHQKPIPYGYGTYLPLFYRTKYPALLTFPADSALDQLSEWRVRYVLVDVNVISPVDHFTQADLSAQPRLHYQATLDGVTVYLLDSN